jgi:hypothetical protein
MFKLTFIIDVSFNNQSRLRLDDRPRSAHVVTSVFRARARTRARAISNFPSAAALLATRPH